MHVLTTAGGHKLSNDAPADGHASRGRDAGRTTHTSMAPSRAPSRAHQPRSLDAYTRAAARAVARAVARAAAALHPLCSTDPTTPRYMPRHMPSKVRASTPNTARVQLLFRMRCSAQHGAGSAAEDAQVRSAEGGEELLEPLGERRLDCSGEVN